MKMTLVRISKKRAVDHLYLECQQNANICVVALYPKL